MTRIRLAPLLLAVTLAPLVACVDNNADAPMVILHNLGPAAGCVLDPAESAFINAGRIQVDSAAGYLFTPVIRNDLTLFEGEPITPKTIFLEGARVDISFYDASLFSAADKTTFDQQGLTKFVAPVSGSIEPGGGLAALGFEIVPDDLLDVIAQRLPAATLTDPRPGTVVDVRVQVFGSRGGGETESNTFRYPVEVCRNCVRIERGSCINLPEGFVAGTGGACNPLQDGILDCCDNGLVCPAAKPQM